jgi:NAD(P)-dependent dehydrogenase (short-subunit alcohol dehydrogenase family)
MRPSASEATVVVTGSGGGIGSAAALHLARAGYRVVGVDREPDALARLRERAGGEDLAINTEIADAADESAMRELFDRVGRSDAGLSGAVLCAGITKRRSVLDTSLRELTELTNVNLAGTFVGIRESGRVLKQGGRGGSIVVITSINALRALPAQAAYSATKAGNQSLVVSAAVELAPFDIRVNAVAPGVILTGMNPNIEPDDDLRQRIPLGRIGTPEDVTGAIEFFLEPRSRYVTGATLVVDGGMRHFR